MAAGDTPITIVGNLVDDPELRFTTSGQPVAPFRVASTPRIRDNATGEWKDGDSLFLTCNVWRQVAENVAESLQRGMRVIVTGRLRQRNYETKEGEKRTVYEVEVDDVGPSPAERVGQGQPGQPRSGEGGFGGGNNNGASAAAATAAARARQRPAAATAAGTTTRGPPTPAAATPTSRRSRTSASNKPTIPA